MIVSCTNCDSKYSVDDSKVEGKKFGFNCPKCGNTVEVDNREKRKKLYDDSDELMSPAGDKGVLIEEKDSGLPSKEELGVALGDLTSETEDEEGNLNIEDMELPNLEGLGEISETGETADDAIDISTDEFASKEFQFQEPAAERGTDFEINEDTGKTDKEDFLAIVGSEKKKAKKSGNEIDLFEDFNPIEEENIENKNTGEKTPDERIMFEEESGNEAAESDKDIMNEVKSDEIFSNKAVKEDEDENITIDLDSLDIQLEEDVDGIAEKDIEIEELSETVAPSKTEDVEIMDFADEIGEKRAKPVKKPKKISEEDEDITLDLDALDLTLDEVEELKEGERMDMEDERIDISDERITLSDAGLTPDELVIDEDLSAKQQTEEDIRLSIDEVAPDTTLEIAPEAAPEVSIKKVLSGKKEKIHMQFDEDELPEIDLDKLDEDDNYAAAEDEESEDIHSIRDFREHEAEIANPDTDIRDTVPRGVINFSIDYSLRFSRIGAIFRLLCLFPVVMIPHFIVLLIYSVLSMILSFFNWIIIVFSGTHEENFLEIQENTIRYLLSICACCVDLVEETPKFAGRKDIDYSFQMDVTYPISYSRILAVLRITVIGIILAALPHLILLLILSIGSFLIYIIGLFSIIIRKKWPNVLFDFMVRYYRYVANVLSFITGVIDRYPSFKFE